MSSGGAAYVAHPSACVDEPAQIGAGTRIWHFSHIMSGAVIGRDCNLGQNCFVASGVQLGDRVKIQNNVSLYAGTVVEDEVFLGPSCVLTNVTNPRAQVDRRSLYEPTLLRRGCSVGANATIVCGVTLGRYSFVGAGAVVSRSVPDYALVVGVPGRVVGYVSRHGHRLHFVGGHATCPESGLRYVDETSGVRCLDLHEDAPLPEHLARGERAHDDWKPGAITERGEGEA